MFTGGDCGRFGSVCRLFGLTAGMNRVKATFWLLDAPDSLEAQGHRNVDGTGVGYFGPDGGIVLDKQPEPAFHDREFQRAARQAESSAFVAHVRWATAGGRTVRNTHPFGMKGRVMAHNGGFGSLARLEAELGPYADLVLGDTDSERYFALITKETDAHGGDVGAGIAAAASWIAAAPAGLFPERDRRGAGRAVGAALPGPARAAHPGPPGGRGTARAQRDLVRCTCPTWRTRPRW